MTATWYEDIKLKGHKIAQHQRTGRQVASANNSIWCKI